MRIAPPVQRAVATCLLVLYAACVALGGGLVRCREANGSVSLEWRGSACCVPTPAPAAPPAPTASADEDPRPDCTGCEDELFTKSLASVVARKSADGEIEAKKAPVAMSTLVVPSWLAREATGERRPHRARVPIPPPPILGLRFAVLRC
jgi:hypothetical protein